MENSPIDLSPMYREDAIERLYDVALDPSQYEAMLDSWEKAFAPLRNNSNLSSSILLDDLTIAKHFKRAEAFLERMDHRKTANPFHEIIAPFGTTAAFMVDQSFHVIANNEAAVQMLNICMNAPVARIDIAQEDIDVMLKNIRKLIFHNDASTVILRLRSAIKGHFIILRLQAVSMPQGDTYVLVASSELRCPEGFANTLREAFNMTKAEADVLQLLVECCSVKDIAHKRGRSVDTVRAQIKSILSKTEARSQIELVRLALSLMDISSFTQAPDILPKVISRGSKTLKDRTYSCMIAPDGRKVYYLVFGDLEGRPVLFLPMDYGLVRWPAQAEQAAEDLGLKIIIPVRAGYGASDPLPKDQDYCTSACEDIQRILKQENATYVPIISVGSDSYLAFRMAYENRVEVPLILATGGVLPRTRPEQYERMDKWHRFILAGAQYTPHLLPFMVKSGFYLARKIGMRGFFHSVYKNSAEDIEIFEQEDVFEAITTGALTAINEEHSAHDGFTRFILGHVKADYARGVASLKGKCEVQFHNGISDPEVPLATFEEFKTDYDWIDFHLHDDCGQMVFFRHWRKILDILKPT